MSTVSYENVLCPDLYLRLQRVFGKVHINNPGVPLVLRPSAHGERPTSIVNGEYYRVCCPWCKEDRFRLYIHHRWFEYRHMAVCFNETACTSGSKGKYLLDQLHLWLFHTTNKISLPVKNKIITAEELAELTEIRPPENCSPLSALPADHEALQYLISRGYDPLLLDKFLGLGWINELAIPTFRDRLYIPIYQGGKLMGYQARIVREDPLRRKQKYMNPMNMKKSRLLYNLDNAKSQNLVVICEGPADVWSVGPCGVAIFGSDCSAGQLSLIGEHFNGKPIVIALDGDAALKAELLISKIQQAAPRSTVIKLPMELDEDPGMLKGELWRRLHNYMSDRGMVMPAVLTEWPNAS